MHTITIQELYNVGLHYGHKKEHSTPMTKPYVYSVRDGICVIDLGKTLEYLENALEVLKQAAQDGKTILFVGTKKQASPLVAAFAQALEVPYVTNRWPGGMLTNFTTIRKSLDHLEQLEKYAASDEFSKLKKREQKRTSDEIAKLHRAFDGIKTLTKLPDMLFVLDAEHEEIAVTEATRLGITTIGTIDTNGDPTKLDLFIPCNDDAPRGIKYVLQRVGEAMSEGVGKAWQAPESLTVDANQPVTVKKAGENGNA
jgi:small subunit ribosomal protein S2